MLQCRLPVQPQKQIHRYNKSLPALPATVPPAGAVTTTRIDASVAQIWSRDALDPVLAVVPALPAGGTVADQADEVALHLCVCASEAVQAGSTVADFWGPHVPHNSD